MHSTASTPVNAWEHSTSQLIRDKRGARGRTEVSVDAVVGPSDRVAADGADHPLRAQADDAASSRRRTSLSSSRFSRAAHIVGLDENEEMLIGGAFRGVRSGGV